MIYDCSIFYKELDLLEIRLHELDSVVDKFVIIEGTKPYFGDEKPLYFQENKNSEVFKPFLDKIIHVIVGDMPYAEGWTREWYLLDRGMEEALENCDDDDIILMSYADEIVSANVLKGLVDELDKLYIFLLSHRYMFFNWVYNAEVHRDFHGTRIGRYKLVRDKFRHAYNRFRWHTGIPHIKNGGWHATSFGGLDRMVDKLKTFSHAPLYKNGSLCVDKDYLRKCIKNVICPINEEAKIDILPINEETTPKYVLENKDKFWYMLWKKGIEKKL